MPARRSYAERVDVVEGVVRLAIDQIGRLVPVLEALHKLEQVAAHGDHGLVAGPQVLPATVEDGTHRLRRHRVVNDEVWPEAGEILGLLLLAIDQIMIADIAD